MKFEEVLPFLRNGKKITNTTIKNDGYKYIYYKKGIICDNTGCSYWQLSDREIVNDDDWEIVEELRKVKLRDLTEEQYREYVKGCEEGCAERICDKCPFREVTCDLNNDNCWFYHKDLYSDKFLDREFEIKE